MLGVNPSEEAVCNDVNGKPCVGDGFTNGMVRLFGQVNVEIDLVKALRW